MQYLTNMFLMDTFICYMLIVALLSVFRWKKHIPWSKQLGKYSEFKKKFFTEKYYKKSRCNFFHFISIQCGYYIDYTCVYWLELYFSISAIFSFKTKYIGTHTFPNINKWVIWNQPFLKLWIMVSFLAARNTIIFDL